MRLLATRAAWWAVCAALIATTAAAAPGAAQGDVTVTVTLGRLEGRMAIAPEDGAAGAGDAVLYVFRVQNLAPVAQSFSLKLTTTPRWRASFVEKGGKTPEIAPGGSSEVPVIVTVPKKVEEGAVGATTLTATETLRSRISEEATVLTTVVAPSGLSVAAAEEALARSGESAVHLVRVTNEGDAGVEVVVVGWSLRGWRVSIQGRDSSMIALSPGQSAQLRVTVSAPRDEPTGTRDALVVVAETAGRPRARAQTVSVTTVD